MRLKKSNHVFPAFWAGALTLFLALSMASAFAGDLSEIKERGVLRHLGVVYSNFVTGSGDGLDVEMVRLFAEHLGVKYEFVETTWVDAVSDLIGKKVVPRGDNIEISGDAPTRGDIIGTGFTILPWREKIVEFSVESFPTQIWLVTRVDSPLVPIQPSGDMEKDISAVKRQLVNQSVLGVERTCLDPNLYGLKEAGASTIQFTMTLNALVPAVINGDAQTTILEVPDALDALQKWPGKIKVIGPLSPMQSMAYAFRKNSPELRDSFNAFLQQCKKDGRYSSLVKKYYPLVFNYYPDFFQ
ncbi:transporter substrate-binding domain-containing protein [Desulforhabdus sp. TSK]|uniref:transporter substrate-binding domain-containing protein n=1 Tax=Desulforhabdus sp. TSK TaxID=2925014 RepID=UPI001FC87DED|nr:transporter substrate-binding domain-containing protein [Desulforhabdus sp. TSK]GKT09552.1 ABC transporter substrate-binding protein [Desulforhabdus sp. TSK]